jgi:hypothetical protein
LILPDQIRAASTDRIHGEAAMAVACTARDRADATVLLDMLGLTRGTVFRWNMPRVAAVAIAKGRLAQEFSAVTLRGLLPRRAWRMIPPALAALSAAGLATQTGRTAKSSAPGARGRKVPLYALTRTGEALAADVAPMPGSGASHLMYSLV